MDANLAYMICLSNWRSWLDFLGLLWMRHWFVEIRSNLWLNWCIIDLRLALNVTHHWFLCVENNRLILWRKHLLILSILHILLHLILYYRLIIILSIFFINYYVLRLDWFLLKTLYTWILDDRDALALWFSFLLFFFRYLNAWHRGCSYNRLIWSLSLWWVSFYHFSAVSPWRRSLRWTKQISLDFNWRLSYVCFWLWEHLSQQLIIWSFMRLVENDFIYCLWKWLILHFFGRLV